MLVALGFLLASLIVFALAPAYWARAVRLTTQRIRQTLPLTEGEIRADKDRIRAEYAVRIHKLEAKVEQAKLAAARRQVELNRRDAAISVLERDVERLNSALEEHQNARRVLEHTVTDRVLVIEQRLAEARRLLEQRDAEVAALNSDTFRSVRALDEAMQINAQQRAEIERLTTVLTTRAVRNREALSDPKFDGEVALRSEIEALRAKTREQADLITRLQAMTHMAVTAQGPAAADGIPRSSGPESRDADSEIERLQRDLAEAEAALKAVRDKAEVGQAGHAALEAQIERLKATVDEQAATIKRLEASLAAHEAVGAESRSLSLKESKIAMKSRLRALQSEVDSQREIIEKLRAELAASNERLALQSAQFRDEMQRLGAGTLPAAGQARRSGAPRVKRSLAERISQAVPELSTSISAPPRPANGPIAPQIGAAAMTADTASSPVTANAGAARPEQQPAAIGSREAAANVAGAAGEPGGAADQKRLERRLKPRLLERISALDKP
jgi:chromosome segregation ATPase